MLHLQLRPVSDLLASLADPSLYGWLPKCHLKHYFHHAIILLINLKWFPMSKTKLISLAFNSLSNLTTIYLLVLSSPGKLSPVSIFSSLLCPHHCSLSLEPSVFTDYLPFRIQFELSFLQLIYYDHILLEMISFL